jgi:hypothetical protein
MKAKKKLINVNLTPKAEKIYMQMGRLGGLRYAVSAALIYFSELPDEDQLIRTSIAKKDFLKAKDELNAIQSESLLHAAAQDSVADLKETFDCNPVKSRKSS